MSKSVYSVVLNDEVISLIDNIAFKKGKSRSTLINEILADYVGFSTDKQRIEEIWSLVAEALEPHQKMRVVRHQQSCIDFLSAINYKYNPRVTYSVELFTQEQNTGYLKIALRTTNQALLSIMSDFFNDFILIEQKHLGDVEYSIVDGKLVRKLCFAKDLLPSQIAIKITTFVNNIDRLINNYTNDYFLGGATEKLERNYLSICDTIDF